MRQFTALLLAAFTLAHGQQQGARPRATLSDRPGVLQTPVQPPEYTGPRGSISGTVTDSSSGAPVRKAQVRLSNLGSMVVTDASGSFTFEQLPPAAYVVTAVQLSYPQRPGSTPIPVQIMLAPGEQKRGVELKLTPGASMAGRVTDDDGDGIAGCNVTVFVRFGSSLSIQGNSATNREGDYLLANLPSGRSYVEGRCQAPVLQPRAFGPPDAAMTGPYLAYASQFYPGNSDFGSAQRVALLPGQDLRGLNFRLVAQKVNTVTVTVSGMDAEKGNRIFVTLLPDDGSPMRPNNMRTGVAQPRTGVAQVASVPPGKYTVQVQSTGPERVVLARVPIVVGEQPKEVAIQVSAPTVLSGLLHLEAQPNAPAQPAALETRPNRLWLSQTGEQGGQSQADVKPDGTFSLRPLGLGKYTVHVPGSGFVQSITLGGVRFEGQEFELTPGAAGTLEVNVSFATGQLSGDVQLGDARPGQVFILAISGEGKRPADTTVVGGVSNQNTHYTSTIRPGRYRLYAVELPPGMAPFQIAESEALAGRGESIDLRPGGEIVRNLKLITAAEIEKAEQ